MLIDDARRVVSANAAATRAAWATGSSDRDLAGALRHPAVLAAVDAVLRGEGDRVVEFDVASPVERHLSARLAPLAAAHRRGRRRGADAARPHRHQAQRAAARRFRRQCQP